MKKMEKRYVLQAPDGRYIKAHARFPEPLRYSMPNNNIYVDDIEFAKMWKRKSSADATFTKGGKALATLQNDIKNIPKNQSWRASSMHYAITTLKDGIKVINTWKVVELEVDANAKKKTHIRFNDGGYKRFTKIDSGHSSSYCNVCGMFLSKLPYFSLGYGKSNICPMCLCERHNEAVTMLEGMNQELRKEIEAERFIRQLG